jgi:hypothetical protein
MEGDDQDAGKKEAGWQYKPDAGSEDAALAPDAEQTLESRADVVEWTASEYIAHEKGVGWYAGLLGAALLAASIIYFLTREMISPIVIMLIAIILAVAGGRKPRVVNYRLDSAGLTIGSRFYPYGQFKSFIMPDEGSFVSVSLIPLKRWDFPIGVFLAPDNQQDALDVLSSHLPLEPHKTTLADTFVRWFRL